MTIRDRRWAQITFEKHFGLLDLLTARTFCVLPFHLVYGGKYNLGDNIPIPNTPN